jgi:8-oxo-dGTP pyrophosphatase MutT (NUDIX family)
MKTRKDISYGVIPIRKVGNTWSVFLINQLSQIGDNSYWIFPKGHPENSETPLETAVRELKEETNLEAELFVPDPTFTLTYTFVFDGVKIEKTVVFFVGVILSPEYKLEEAEVQEAGWYSLEEAAERLDYQDTKHMFVAARKFIETFTE